MDRCKLVNFLQKFYMLRVELILQKV